MTIRADLAALQVNAGLIDQLLDGDESTTVEINSVAVPSYAKRAADAAAAAVAPYASASAIATAAAASATAAAASAANAVAVVSGGTAQLNGGNGKIPLCDSNGNLGLYQNTSADRYFNITAAGTNQKGGFKLAGEFALWYQTNEGVGNTAGVVRVGLHAGKYLSLSNYNFSPSSDNNVTSGDASHRYSTIYAGTGTINTSDATEKTAVSAFSQAEINAAKAMAREIGLFQFLDAVAAKGADNARRHVGLTVQRAIEIMEAEGLQPFRYAFICLDTWTDEEGQERQRYGFRYDQLNQFVIAGIAARLDALELALA